ncbi:Putative mono-oxygenase ydhR [Actinopolyspora mzabensis]|uniref:Putative mono-oxygenase ydhR n=1 Tax=Actinopolyspora mzabensis TaxID=995066 RepID=A0A1G9AHS2_ACTMZ|nr:monooxygenase [Actinopolyspora mzabensis]SDK26887.1 Putative mono-oxygenase ydhR [Actinopolyspora mzabensis]
MPCLLQIDFPTQGPFGAAMTEAFTELAESIDGEPGLLWKIWTENRETAEAGGVYLFESHETAQRYLRKHTERLTGFGITGITAKVFDVNESLSRINHAPLRRE